MKRFAVDRHTACTALRCNSGGAAAVVLVGSGVPRVLKGFSLERHKVPSSSDVAASTAEEEAVGKCWDLKDASTKNAMNECWSCRVLEGLDSCYVRRLHPFPRASMVHIPRSIDM